MRQLATLRTLCADEPSESSPGTTRSPDKALRCTSDTMNLDQHLPALKEYVPHPSFDDPALEGDILGPMPQAEEFETRRREMRIPRSTLPELAPLYGMPLLSKEQEQHLFRQMNYLKYKAAKLAIELRQGRPAKAGINSSRARTQKLREIEGLLTRANQLKELLINANMRLVVKFVKQNANPFHNFYEMLSDGNLSLIRAVEKFDFSRNFKFCTYATRAIMTQFARTIPGERNQRQRFVTGHEEALEWAQDNRTVEQDMLATQKRAMHSVNWLLDYLEPREREIIRMRAGLDDRPRAMTLEEIGRKFGITKERVRQLNNKAMKKLQSIAERQQLDQL